MSSLPNFADYNIALATPVIVLAVWGTLLLIVDLFIAESRKHITAWLAVAGLAVTFIINLVLYNVEGEAFLGMFVTDQFSSFMNIVVLVTAFISILLSIDYLRRTGIERGEYYPLILLTTAGIMFMGHANDLITVFVALEMLSIPLYIMAAFRYPELKSEEAGLKYFILGAFSSAFFVYGAALIYGATGATNLGQIFDAVARIVAGEGTSSFLLLLGSGLVLVGLGFKVAVVPFHMWTPDVYQGAPTPVTAFMSVGAKAGGFAALLRILAVGLPAFMLVDGQTAAAWQTTVWVVAAATLLFANFVAIAQTDVKRLLAYSSIAHAGYIMMAVAAAGTAGIADQAAQAVLVYLLAYAFTNLGAFGVALAIEKNDGTGTTLEDFVGLAKSRPLLAMMMTVFMLSLIGIPLTGGFIGKWMVFAATLQAGLIPLAVIGVLTSVVSAFYYVRIIINMYLREGEGDAAAGATNYVSWGVYAAFAGTLLLGIFPALVINLSSAVNMAVAVAGR